MRRPEFTASVMSLGGMNDTPHLPNIPKRFENCVGQPKCFLPSMVKERASCKTCVNFLSIANRDRRWGSINPMLSALRMMVKNLELSQRCFKLHLYTNIPLNSTTFRQLVDVTGNSVHLYTFPTDLPRNTYSGTNSWMELSRRKLDLVLRHTTMHGHKVIWTDLDTVVLTDLSCAYELLQNFVVSRDAGRHVLRGPEGKSVAIRRGYSVYGDLWMVDMQLAQHIWWLEKSGMPPPKYDLQDYLSYLLNRCNGTVTDLRGFLRDERDGGGLCLGFDFSGGSHPSSTTVFPMRVRNGVLLCSVPQNGTLVYRPLATMSFTFITLQQHLRNPRGIFKTNELAEWARRRGFGIQG